MCAHHHLSSHLFLIRKCLFLFIYLGYEQWFLILQPPSECKPPWCASWQRHSHQPPSLSIPAPHVQIAWFVRRAPKVLCFCVACVSLCVHRTVRTVNIKASTHEKHFCWNITSLCLTKWLHSKGSRRLNTVTDAACSVLELHWGSSPVNPPKVQLRNLSFGGAESCRGYFQEGNISFHAFLSLLLMV